jgi:hypothetical protein
LSAGVRKPPDSGDHRKGAKDTKETAKGPNRCL